MNADIRIYPDKEMKALDMAEVIDAAVVNNGIVQGCTLTLSNGALKISAGRILIKGRLGVVEAGTISLPTLSSTQTCYLLAVCDLAIENPFYISFFTSAGKQELDNKAAYVSDNNYNTSEGVRYVLLGTATINPTTNKITKWTPVSPLPSAKNTQIYSALNSTITTLANKIGSTTMGTTATTVTAAIKELVNKIGSATIGTEATTITGAIHEVYLRSVHDRDSITALTNKIGSVAMGTSATTITGAIKELLSKITANGTKITTNTSNIAANSNRITSLQSKTAGLEKIGYYTADASGGKRYFQLHETSSYLLITNGYTTATTVGGMYLIGVTSNKTIVITPIKSASSVAVADVGGGVVRITNSSSVTLRITLATLSGTAA